MSGLPKNVFDWFKERKALKTLFDRQDNESPPEAVNPERRAERAEMKRLGFKSKKRFRKWQKEERRREREEDVAS